MKTWFSLIAVTMLVASGQAAMLQKGTTELTVNGDLDPKGPGGASVALDAGYGLFIEDDIEVGGRLIFSDTDAATLYGLGGFGEINFDQGTELVPFVGAGLSWINAEMDKFQSDESALVLSGYGGVKYFLAENVAITGQLNIDLATEDIYVNDDKLDDMDISLTVGMRFFLP